MNTRMICFTINNAVYDDTPYTRLPGDPDYINPLAAMIEWGQVTYMIAGNEVAATGTPHIQGFAQFKDKVKFTTIKKKMPTAHIEAKSPNSTAEQARDYCKKEDDYTEWGTFQTQGQRKDIEIATQMITNGEKMRTVAKELPVQYVKYHKGLHALKNILIEPRTEVPKVTVLYGKTGTGKSKSARELTVDPYVWGPEQMHWFDGYEGQKDVIFEEFRGQLPLGMLLRLLDRYDCKVQVKGGIVEFVGTNIVITSPKHPDEWYEDLGNDKIDQLMRRITEIKHLG